MYNPNAGPSRKTSKKCILAKKGKILFFSLETMKVQTPRANKSILNEPFNGEAEEACLEKTKSMGEI